MTLREKLDKLSTPSTENWLNKTAKEIENLDALRQERRQKLLELSKSRAITGPYAGAVCPKCGQGMNHKQNITLSEEEEARDRKRYGRGICDDCKTERQQNEHGS